MRRIFRLLRRLPAMFGVTVLRNRSVSSGSVHDGFSALPAFRWFAYRPWRARDEPGKDPGIGDQTLLSIKQMKYSVRCPSATAPPFGTVRADGNGCQHGLGCYPLHMFPDQTHFWQRCCTRLYPAGNPLLIHMFSAWLPCRIASRLTEILLPRLSVPGAFAFRRA